MAEDETSELSRSVANFFTFGEAEGETYTPPSLITGIRTFIGAPVVPPVEAELRRAGVKAAVLGFPWEGSNTARPGASYGPRAIRLASEQYRSVHGEFEVDLFEALRLCDCGDVMVSPGNREKTFRRATACVREICEAGAFPIVFGGDDSCPITVVDGVVGASEAVTGYIHLDSHLDTIDAIDGERFTHASTVARIAEIAGVDTTKIVIAGLNGPLNVPQEWRYVEEKGISAFSIWDIDSWGIDKTIERISEVVWGGGVDRVVLHTDLDVLDQGFAAGVTTPEVGGLAPRDILKMVRAFAREGIDAYVITECSPVYDHANNSARVAVRLALDVLGVRANPEASGGLNASQGRANTENTRD
jgi:agmatinase